MTDAAVWFPGAHVGTQPDTMAVVSAAGDGSRTYRELHQLATRTARLLESVGVGFGDHVALWFDNDLDFPAWWWGAHYAGTHYTLISARLTPAEAAYIIEDSGARAVLLGRRLHEQHHDEVVRLIDTDVAVIADVAGPGGLRALIERCGDAPLEDPLEGTAMLYSSGTTGQPKGVKRQLTGLPLGTSPGVAELATGLFGLSTGSVYLSPAPLYHAAPCGYVSAATATGATAVIMERFDAESFLAAIERHGVTHTQVVPTMFSRLLELPEEVRTRYDLSSLQCVVHAAAPCPIPLKERMFEWWGPIIHEYYSGTEGVGFVYCSPKEWLAHRGSVGRPVAGQVHIVGDDGNEVPVGVDGTVYFEGGRPFEYHNDQAKTAASHLANGWSTLGDIGHMDADGFLYLTDRRSNMIIVGGVNVYPQEAEDVLAVHPAVFDAAVVGVPDHDLGEVPKAYVQLAANVEATQELADELLAHCRTQLASIKVPRTVEFRRSLPREPNGKLLKRLLRDEARSAQASTSSSSTA